RRNSGATSSRPERVGPRPFGTSGAGVRSMGRAGGESPAAVRQCGAPRRKHGEKTGAPPAPGVPVPTALLASAATRRDAARAPIGADRGRVSNRLGADAAIACPCQVAVETRTWQGITSFVEWTTGAWTLAGPSSRGPPVAPPGVAPAALIRARGAISCCYSTPPP